MQANASLPASKPFILVLLVVVVVAAAIIYVVVAVAVAVVVCVQWHKRAQKSCWGILFIFCF